MKKSKRRPFRSLKFVLFAVLIGAFLILPVSALLMAKQDVADAPPRVEFANQKFFPRVQSTAPTAPTAPFAVTVPQVAPNPFGVPPYSQFARFPQADPMQSFVDKIRNAEDEDAKQDAIDQAKAALEKHYEKYIDAYEQQVDEMESRLQKLRDQLDKRKEAKNKLVSLKLEMITSQADGIGWPDATDRPNTQRFPDPAMWRTKPRFFSPAVPSAVREVPVPGAAAQPSDANSFHPVPLGTAQSQRRGAAVGPLATTVGPQLATAPQTSRTYSIAKGAVAESVVDHYRRLATTVGPETAVFDTFFETGIQLLEERKYGEFLDRFLQPEEFRKELKSATLDEVSKKFAEESADLILKQFRLAMGNPIRTYDPTAETLTWKTITGDGEMKQLTLVRDGDQWYLSLRNSDQDDRQTR